MGKKHFTGLGKVKIHTARYGKCESFGNCVYGDNVTKPTPLFWPNRVHHLLPVTAYIRYKGEKAYKGKVQVINAVYKATKYCAHQTKNLLYMPDKKTYGAKPITDAIWKTCLPCHDLHHGCNDGYTEEVIEEFRAKIWDPIRDQSDDEKCADKKFPMLRRLRAMEKKFLETLQDRGSKRTDLGGPAPGRDELDEGEPATTAAGSNTWDTYRARKERPKFWWLPFSMAKDEIARANPVRTLGPRRPSAPHKRKKKK